MNNKSGRGFVLMLLLLPLLGGITVAQVSSSASASVSSQGPVRAAIGTFVCEQGTTLGLEIVREKPCPCLCETIEVTGLQLLDANENPVPFFGEEELSFPILSEGWVGRVELRQPSADPLPEGAYTVVITTSIGEFRAKIQVVAPGGRANIGRLSSRASVCGTELRLYRLVDEKNDGQSVFLRRDDLLLVALSGNPTTGYEWKANAQASDILEPLTGVDYHPNSSLIGAGGSFYFRYRAVKAGEGTLAFVYRRLWEETNEKEVSIAIIVY